MTFINKHFISNLRFVCESNFSHCTQTNVSNLKQPQPFKHTNKQTIAKNKNKSYTHKTHKIKHLTKQNRKIKQIEKTNLWSNEPTSSMWVSKNDVHNSIHTFFFYLLKHSCIFCLLSIYFIFSPFVYRCFVLFFCMKITPMIFSTLSLTFFFTSYKPTKIDSYFFLNSSNVVHSTNGSYYHRVSHTYIYLHIIIELKVV